MEEKKTLIGRTAKVTNSMIGLDLLQQVSVAVGPGEYIVLSDPYPVASGSGLDFLAIRIKDNAGRDIRISYDANMIVAEEDDWCYVMRAIRGVQNRAVKLAAEDTGAVFMLAINGRGKDINHGAAIVGDCSIMKAMLCAAAECNPTILALLESTVNAVRLKMIEQMITSKDN